MAHLLPPLTSDLTEDADWDTTVVVHTDLMEVIPERRHSGWESVERKWVDNAQLLQPLGSVRNLTKEVEAMAYFPYPQTSIPTPLFDFDFRIKVILNPRSASVSVNDGFKKLTTVVEGIWSGCFGHGLVNNGAQESQDLPKGKTTATQVEATYRLQTKDEPPAYIECKSRGNRIGPPDVMKALEDPETAGSVDPRSCQYRVFITMKTSDERYVEKLNTGMWVGSCLWKGVEVVCDAYRIS
ncbi:hypothetical protein GGR54DRAFT_317267 [Hypoxylon sp. NC1633]|nr:hypothetical protein GGR54DRAFT_317267 [Hypoxylon sp. NC1633]